MDIKELIRKKAVKKITQARLESGFSQAQLAVAIDKPTAYIINLEKGKIDPEISVLLTISDVLNFHFSDYFGPFWDHPLSHFVKNN